MHLTYLVLAFALIIPSLAYAQESENFPNWYPEFVGMWTERQIADDEFILSTEYLVNQNLIPVSLFDPTSSPAGIPDWLKNTADWWTDGIASDSELLSSLEFLVDTGMIKKTAYSPDSLFYNFAIDVEKLEAREKITWTLKDNLPHTITSGTPAKSTPLFSSGIIHKGESVSHVLENGVYSFFCMMHPWETDTLTVPVVIEDYQRPKPDFVDETKDPYYYVGRYLNELEYRNWFHENYSDYTIYDAVGISESDYLLFAESEKEKAIQLEQKRKEESGELAEEQAQEILADFGSTSLSIISVSNSDGQLYMEYMEEFFTMHIDKFNPVIVQNTMLMKNDPEKYLDLALTDAELSQEFYSGQILLWRDIFKTKSQGLDHHHVRSLEKIQNLDLEDSRKEYHVAEINKAKQTFENMLDASTLMMIQPLEEKIAKFEYTSSSKDTIPESNLSENDPIDRIIAAISDFLTSLLSGIQSII